MEKGKHVLCEKPLALDEKCDYHRSKAIGETIVLDACARGLNATIVNPGSMIGPHDYEPSMIGAALIDIHLGRVPVLLELLSDYVDVRDVADGMIAAAENGRVGERYFLTGDVVPIMEMVFGSKSRKRHAKASAATMSACSFGPERSASIAELL